MKILVLNYEYPPVGGGGGRVAQLVSRALVGRGHEVVVLTSHLRGLPLAEREDGVAVRRVRCLRRRADRCSVAEMAAYVACSVVPALLLTRRWRPDLIHAHFAVPTGPVAYAVHRATGVPYVLTAHLGDVPGGVPPQTDRLFRWLGPLIVPTWRRAAAVTAVSAFVGGLVSRAYSIEPSIIVNGIDLSAFPRTVREPSSPVRLVWVGRLQEQKNVLRAIEELGAIRDLPWHLDLLGDGPQRRDAEALADRLGLLPKISFQGWVPSSQADEVVARADILYVTSLSEGLSMASVQALACGLAVVGSAIGGLADVVQHGTNGFLCSLAERGSFARALRELCEDPGRLARMKAESRARADLFDQRLMLDRYEETFRAVSSRAR